MAAAAFRAALPALACLGCTTIAPSAQTFAGTHWRIAAINGEATIGDYPFEFEASLFHAGLGCNGASGNYRVASTMLIIDRAMTTERACADMHRQQLEETALRIMREPMQIRPNGRDSIVLMSGPGTLVLDRLP